MADKIQMHPILFYDGNCGFCNRSIQFILAQERNEEIHFCALQSPLAQKELECAEINTQDLSTIYFKRQAIILSKSSAVFAILPFLKWYWQPLRIFQYMPKKWTDNLYNFIAKRRMKLASSFCVIPSARQMERFLK